MLSWIKGFNAFKKTRHDGERSPAEGQPTPNLPRQLPNQSDRIAEPSERRPARLPSRSHVSETAAPAGVLKTQFGEPVDIVSCRIRVPQSPQIGNSQFDDARAAIELETPISNLRLASPKQTSRLRSLGIETVGELLGFPTKSLEKRLGFGASACRSINAWKTAIRLQRCVPELTLTTARQLVAIHRTSPADLARALPARIAADLRRLANSSSGQKLFRGGPPAAKEEIQTWIESARQSKLESPST